MSGVMIFESMEAAERAGFEICDRYSEGYVVRVKTANGYAMALVRVRSEGR